MSLGVGWLKQITGNFVVMFLIAGLTHLTARLIFHLLAPEMDSAIVEQNGGDMNWTDQVNGSSAYGSMRHSCLHRRMI